VAAEIAREEQFASALGGYVRDSAILTPEAYALLLERCGYREQHVRLQVYVHRLESREAVVEWVKGTLLTAYRRRLSDELYAEFLEAYRARLFTRLEDARPFPYAFKRMLLWARR
jgi:trans-aconitate 2-methyltransferase